MNQNGYDNSETTVGKLLARRIQICRIHFSVIIFLTSHFFKQVKIWSQQKWAQQILIRLVECSSAEVSDASEVPRFVGKLIF